MKINSGHMRSARAFQIAREHSRTGAQTIDRCRVETLPNGLIRIFDYGTQDATVVRPS